MKQLNETTLARLRDRLRERGQRPTIAPQIANLPQAALELLHITTEYGPLCEAMYLVMAADGTVQNVERDVLKGALREVTDDGVRGMHIEALLDASAKRLAREGYETRLEIVLAKLREDPVTAECAYMLACAVALADGVIHVSERKLLDTFAEGLSIDPDVASQLMDELAAESKT